MYPCALAQKIHGREAVRQWYLEGESGARLHTRGTIAFLVRRRVTGAICRAIANHLNNRLWLVGASVPNANGDGPQDGFGDSPFSDPYNRHARKRHHRNGSGGG